MDVNEGSATRRRGPDGRASDREGGGERMGGVEGGGGASRSKMPLGSSLREDQLEDLLVLIGSGERFLKGGSSLYDICPPAALFLPTSWLSV